MEPLTIVFHPTPQARRFRLLLGLFFLVVGGGLALAFLVMGGLAVWLTARPGQESLPVGGALLCCGTPFALCFVVAGVWVAFFAGRDEQVVLDAERFTSQEHALPLERIVRVSAVQGWQRRVPYWTVRVEDDAGGVVALEVTQGRYVGSFDVREVLRALLPRLPAACAVEPRVRAYAEGAPMA